MDSTVFDKVDRDLAHALQIDGRAPFNRIAEVLGVSDSTVARRYHRLHSAGLLRVVASVNLSRLGYVPWTIRLQCTPDAAGGIAAALARRTDTFWVHLLSGGTEISCGTQAGPAVAAAIRCSCTSCRAPRAWCRSARTPCSRGSRALRSGPV